MLSSELLSALDSTPKNLRDTEEYNQCLYMLMCAYEKEGNKEGAGVVARKLIRKCDEIKDEILRTCYDVLARCGDFEAYMIAMEWNRPLEKKFYIPRSKIFKSHGVIQAFQDVNDDKVDYLILNMPPRTGKSTLGIFFMTFRAGEYPEQSILGTGHSAALTQSFYREFLEMVTSEEYRFKEIFPTCNVVNQNAEIDYVDFNTIKRFHTVNYRPITGGTTGLVEASNLLYCDDLVVDAEEANNKDRLDKLFEEYVSTTKDRKTMRLCKDGEYRPCPEIHIATPWSLYDPISRIIKDVTENGNSDRLRVVKVPCWNENGESNFQYDYGLGFDRRYYEEMERVEDPVLFSAKYLMEPIEREGRPFEKGNLSYYTELPIDENGEMQKPDRIVAVCDVAHGGEDYLSLPIAYVYGDKMYVVDVLFIHKFNGDTYSRPLVCNKLMSNLSTACAFERNNGGDFYATLISQDLVNRGYRCNITTFNAPTTKSKLDRILSYQYEICNNVYFKHPNMLKGNQQYTEFLHQIWGWSQQLGTIQKKQHDDSVDSVAMLLDKFGTHSIGGFKLYDIRKAGY